MEQWTDLADDVETSDWLTLLFLAALLAILLVVVILRGGR
jgi:hypothetical protein